MNTLKRVLTVVEIPSNKGLRQPEQAEKACHYKHELHELTSRPIQSDPTGFQDCPWLAGG